VALEGLRRRGHPAEYNKAWWDLKLKYQGVAPPSGRGEEFFDPGAKYHVPDNTPYTRYFLADILQFQFHRALTKVAGCTLPLNRCSTYGNKAAGERLNAMLSMGLSRPWPEALEALTGSKQMDATRSSTTSRRCRNGSTNSCRDRRSVGSAEYPPWLMANG
jgi:Angiotensin-converting enzyme.